MAALRALRHPQDRGPFAPGGRGQWCRDTGGLAPEHEEVGGAREDQRDEGNDDKRRLCAVSRVWHSNAREVASTQGARARMAAHAASAARLLSASAWP
eukprot:512592-Prymnesium_polylepis.1